MDKNICQSSFDTLQVKVKSLLAIHPTRMIAAQYYHKAQLFSSIVAIFHV
jgi:hypothetical protein